MGGPPLAGGHAVVGGGAGRVVGLAPAAAVPEPARPARGAAAGRERGRHDRAVAVDTGEVDSHAAGRPVEFGGRGWAALGPGRLVPVGAEHHIGGAAPDVLGELVEGVGQGRRPGQVEPVKGEPGGGHVHVGVHERGGDQGVVEVHGLLGGQGVGGRVRAEPGDPAVLDQHRRRERGRRAVDPPAAVKDAPGAVAPGSPRPGARSPGVRRRGGHCSGTRRSGTHRLSVLFVQRVG